MSARILIVDDMLPSVKVLAAKLTGEYYEVLTALDGPTALDIIREKKPDLVLLDVMMPGMDGFEVCRRIKLNTETAHIPVVMVTALSETSDRVQGLQSGADDFLTKPVSDVTLFARVRSLVRLKRTLDQWLLREETTQKMGILIEKDSTMRDDGGGARITLVDSSAIQSSNIRDVLARDGDKVTIVEEFTGAAEAMAEDDPDLAIISLTAEEDIPLRLCSQLRSLEETRHLPILLLGDEEDTDRLVRALEIGINDYLVRPIDEYELLARVRTQVRRKRYQDRLRTSFLRSLSLALTDSLTGLHNRRYLVTHLEALMKRMAESEKPLALLMIDIDHFKRVNDSHGHAVGDKVLTEVAQRIARGVRGFDLVSRYGGEEFVVVMPDTESDVAVAVSDRLRQRIADEPIQGDEDSGPVTVTVSIGVAETNDDIGTPEGLMKAADAALYQAKREGRNRVIPEPKEGVKIPLEADID